MKEEDVQTQLAQAYGFTLKLVDDSGYSCLMCHWLKVGVEIGGADGVRGAERGHVRELRANGGHARK